MAAIPHYSRPPTISHGQTYIVQQPTYAATYAATNTTTVTIYTTSATTDECWEYSARSIGDRNRERRDHERRELSKPEHHCSLPTEPVVRQRAVSPMLPVRPVARIMRVQHRSA